MESRTLDPKEMRFCFFFFFDCAGSLFGLSLVAERGSTLVAVHGLIAVASPVAEL